MYIYNIYNIYMYICIYDICTYFIYIDIDIGIYTPYTNINNVG